jgi:hypothetical protein
MVDFKIWDEVGEGLNEAKDSRRNRRGIEYDFGYGFEH